MYLFVVHCAGEVRSRHRDVEYFQELCFENVDFGRFPILREPATSVDREESQAADAAAAGTASSGMAYDSRLCFARARVSGRILP